MALGRTFTGQPGQPSTSTGGPNEIKADIDVIMKAINDTFAALGIDISALGVPNISAREFPFYADLASDTLGESGAELTGYPDSVDDTVYKIIKRILSQGSGSIPPDLSITNAKLAADVKMGSLALLNTSNKSSAVSAVNEVLTKAEVATGTVIGGVVNVTSSSLNFIYSNLNKIEFMVDQDTTISQINVDNGPTITAEDKSGNPLVVTTKDIIVAVYRLNGGSPFFLLASRGGIGGTGGTATAGDILSGETAYVGGALITGTIPVIVGYTPSTASDGTLYPGYLYLRPGMGYYNGVDNFIYIYDPSYIEANIKKGVSIFGRIGTFNDLVVEPGSNLLNIPPASYTHNLSAPQPNFIYIDRVGTNYNTVKANYDGQYRIAFQIFISTYNVTNAYGQVYKNGVAIGALRQIVNVGTFTEDLTFAKNDLIQFKTWIDNSAYNITTAYFYIQSLQLNFIDPV